ncbi:MAG: nitrilase-related carbon-nitrogen hydrolase, partial [Armatimonadota bacterium]|nr:nitrilase-related carbon-nitrogen hydrolase [Armatimonadota bacterium]
MPIHHQDSVQRRFTVGVGQFKPTKGQYQRNLERIGQLMAQALQEGVDVLALPETATTGYFIEGGVRELAMPASRLLADLACLYADLQPDRPLDICVGFYEYLHDEYFNSALYATLEPDPTQSRLLHVHQKFFLPTYGVFEEERFVARGRRLDTFMTRFGRAAMLICEDVWHSVTSAIVALKGAQVLYVPTASPARGFHSEQIENVEAYRRMLTQIAGEHTIYVVQSSLVGFEGGKGFVGSSWIVDPFGKVMAQGPVNQEALIVVPLDLDDVAIARAQLPLLSDLRSVIADVALQFEE